ncbi:hypothetical protein BD309DRAFT_653287 [Dichomitus squalens]|nr:hypothetical protein BD309DRAFT_653287 [Dichomitus squalens]
MIDLSARSTPTVLYPSAKAATWTTEQDRTDTIGRSGEGANRSVSLHSMRPPCPLLIHLLIRLGRAVARGRSLCFHRTQYPTLSAATLCSKRTHARTHARARARPASGPPHGCPCTKSPVPSAPPVCLYHPRACNAIAVAHRLDRADNSIIIALDV